MNFDGPHTDSASNKDSAVRSQIRSVESVLTPKTIAIVGVSDRGEGGWSKIMFDNLKDAGFPAKVFLVYRFLTFGHLLFFQSELNFEKLPV